MSLAKKLARFSAFKFSVEITGVLVIGIVIWFSFSSVQTQVRESHNKKFELLKHEIQEKLESYVYGLQGAGGVYISSNYNPSPKSFRSYADFRGYFKNFPGALGFGFIRRVHKNDLSKYFSQRRKDFNQEMQLRNYSNLRFADDHKIIEVIEPFENNGNAIGLDLSSDLKRNQAAIESMMTNKPIISAPLPLRIYNSPGFLILYPIFKDRKETTPENLVGWAFAPISGENLKHYISSAIDPGWFLDISDSNGEEIFSVGNRHVADEGGEEITGDVKLSGRTWVLKGTYLNDVSTRVLPILSLLGFTLLSLLHVFATNKFFTILQKNNEVEDEKGNLELFKESILDASEFTILASDLNGNVTLFNKACEKILGYKREEVLGKPAPESLHLVEEIEGYSLELERTYGVKIQRGAETFTYRAIREGSDSREWTVRSKTGELIPMRVCISPLKDINGEIIGFLAVSQDLREMKKLQTAMVSGAKMSALGEMTAGIAHEINNPLAIINLASAALLKQASRSPQVQSEDIISELKTISETCVRISTIVRGFRNFSRDASDDPMKPVKFSQILDDALALSGERLKAHHFEIIVEGNKDFKVNCRPTQISQVLINLFNNSFDATKTMEKKWVKLQIKEEGDLQTVCFSDAGLGIPPEVLAKLMTPFFTTKENGQGTGLGLSICKKIVEDHKGTFGYLDGQGHTTFQLQFPKIAN